jgi:serine protease inhibitor
VADCTSAVQCSAVQCSAVQCSEVQVTKEGTEGAAGTGVEVTFFSVADKQEFLGDKPFIFVVRDGIHKIPILVGKVNDPSK